MKKLALTFILLAQFKSFGCDCVTSIGMKDAKSVFEGKVIGIEKIETPFIRYQIKFRVTKIIKGKVSTPTIIVNEPSLNVGGCGVPFEINDNYCVFTYVEHKMLYTGNCTETKKLED